MKYIVCIFLILTIAFAVQSSSKQPHLAKSSLGKILKSTKLGNGLVSLVSLFAKTQQDAPQEDWDELFEALDLLKESLVQKTAEENEAYELEGQESAFYLGFLQQYVDQHEWELIEYEGQLEEISFTLDSLNTEKADLQGQLQGAQDHMNQVEEQMKAAHETYEEEQRQYEEALKLIGQAIEKLSQAQDNLPGVEFVQFLQANQNNFQSFSVLLENSVHKLKDHKNILLKPVTKIFADLYARNTQELTSERVANAIGVLEELQMTLRAGQVSSEVRYLRTSEVLNAEYADAQAFAYFLTDMIIPQVNEAINMNQDQYDAISDIISDLEAIIQEIEDEIAEEQESWEQRTRIHEKLIPRLQEEYEIVVAAEEILRNRQA